ncbi:MAG: preprotein translocase subunit SecG [Planctomycetota bacterium]
MFETVQFAAWVAVWFLCPILVGLVLIQGGNSDMGSAFGGGSQLDSSLGVGAVRKISKITAWLVLIFMACVILVAIRTGETDLQQLAGDEPVEEPLQSMTAAPDDAPVMVDPEAEGDTVELPVEAGSADEVPVDDVETDAAAEEADDVAPAEADDPTAAEEPADAPAPLVEPAPDDAEQPAAQ